MRWPQTAFQPDKPDLIQTWGWQDHNIDLLAASGPGWLVIIIAAAASDLYKTCTEERNGGAKKLEETWETLTLTYE